MDSSNRDDLLAEVAALRQRLAEAERERDHLRASEAALRQLVHYSNTIVLRWDSQGRILFLNDWGLNFFGYRAEEVLGKSVIGILVPETESSGRDLVYLMGDILRHPERYLANENENIRRNGERAWVTWRNQPVVDSDGRLVEIVSTGIDTTEGKRAEERLRASEEKFRELSMHDNLTGLFNTRYLFRAIDELVASCRSSGECLSLVFADLDHFKAIVDTYGHLNGSRVIQEIAHIIHKRLVPPAFAAAYAGDEFVLVLPATPKDRAVELAHEIRAHIVATSFLREEGHRARLSASFGVATYPDDGLEPRILLAAADQALFAVKARGRDDVGVATMGR